MTLKEVLRRIRIGNRIEIYSEQYQTTVFKGSSDIIDHSVSKLTLSPYLDREVWCLSAVRDTIIIYCK